MLGSLVLVALAVAVIEVTSIPIFANPGTTAATPYSHISSFLNQKKSDSRAEKKDADFSADSNAGATTRKPVTRVQVYKHVVGTVVEDIRGKVKYAIAQGQKDSNTDQEPLRITVDITDQDFTTEFPGLTLSEDPDDLRVVFETGSGNLDESSDPLQTQDPFSSYKNVLSVDKIRNKSLVLSSYVLNPLYKVWTAARQRLPALIHDGSDKRSRNDFLFEGGLGLRLREEVQKNLREMPLRSSFYKYLNLVEKGSRNKSGDNVPVQMANVLKQNQIDLETSIDGAHESPIYQDTKSSGKFLFRERPVIYVLEVIGTIAGLAWGAIGQIQSLFRNEE